MKKLVYFLVLFLVISSCSVKEKPIFLKVDNIKITSTSTDTIHLKAEAFFKNPNDLGGQISTDEIKVIINGAEVAHVSSEEFKVPARNEFTIPLKVVIPTKNVFENNKNGLLGGILKLTSEHPEKFNAIGSESSSIPFATIFTGMVLVQLFYWGTNQQIIQRALAAKNLKEGQKGVMLAACFKILGPLIVVLPGIIAFHMFDGQLDRADQAYPKLVAEVLPVTLVGFFAAVLFGAILSSFNSALNSSVTLFGLDIYKSHINKEATELQVVKAGKKFGILLAIISMFVAPLVMYAGSIFGYLQEANGIYSIPILTIIVVGYFTKKVPASAAKFGIISGSIMYIISQFILKPFVFGHENYPHFLHVMAILFVLNIVIMLVIGKLKPRKTAFTLPYTKQVDITPWKYVKLAGIIICIIVIYSYLHFS